MHGRENQKLIKPVIFRKRRGRRAGRKQGIPTEPSESELKLNPWAVRETGVHTDAPIGTAALLELLPTVKWRAPDLSLGLVFPSGKDNGQLVS